MLLDVRKGGGNWIQHLFRNSGVTGRGELVMLWGREGGGEVGLRGDVVDNWVGGFYKLVVDDFAIPVDDGEAG